MATNGKSLGWNALRGGALSLFVASLAPVAQAQGTDQDVGAWFIFAGQGHFHPEAQDARWRWWLDAQLRFSEDSDGFDQSILRPGVGYDLSQDTTLWLGYGWFHNDPALGPTNDEHRIWQQLTWNFKLGANSLQSRTRLEQRFPETGDDVGWRFREFVRFTPPPATKSGLGLRFWDELFFDLNDTDWGADAGFAQNRFFAGVGWTLDEDERFLLEVGYLNQYIDRSFAADSMNHILFAQLIFTL